MLIGKSQLCSLIPHAGDMCLLDGVLVWDAQRATCVSHSHRRGDHPLRRQGRLAALVAFEYAAQAAAVHGALTARAAGKRAAPGWLAALRDARLHIDFLDNLPAPLHVEVVQRFGGAGDLIYDSEVTADGAQVAEARITVLKAGG